MDYEQKYKSALAWMQSLYPGLHGNTREEAEKYFPELQESEDEKVKRTLLSISSKMSFHLHDIFTEEEFQCFDAWSNAWLKKQDKPKWTDEDEHTLQGVIDEIQANKNQAPDYDLETYDRFLSWLNSLKQRMEVQL